MSDPSLPQFAEPLTGREPMLPVTGESFGLMTARSASERMHRLCRFIEFWLGPRKPEYGEPSEALDAVQLPEPLRILYAFAGRWPHAEARYCSEHFVPAFSHEDVLASLHRIRRTDDGGKVIVLHNNRRNFRCLTLPVGDDPPVWSAGLPGEHLVCPSLSRFLVSFVLQELMLGSRRVLDDAQLDDLFESTVHPSHALWLDGPYVQESEHTFHLWNHALVGLWGLFAANHAAGEAFLNANRSPISAVDILLNGIVELQVKADGSGRLRGRGNSTVKLPPGTFPFDQVCDALLAAASDTGRYDANPTVRFHRTRQIFGVDIRPLRDMSFVNSLFAYALARAPASPGPP